MKTLQTIFLALLISCSYTLQAEAIYYPAPGNNDHPVTLIDGHEPAVDRSSLLRNFCNRYASKISWFAHPTTTYKYSSSKIYGNTAYINITYYSNMLGKLMKMKAKVWVNQSGMIGGVSIVSDESFIPAFMATSIIKREIDILLRDVGGSKTSTNWVEKQVEQMLRKTYYRWNGRDFCLFLLNVGWLGDGYYKAY